MSESTITEPFLRKLRETIDADPALNVSNLSVKAGLGNSTIRLMLAQNKSPRVKTMRAICSALGTTLEEFISEAETPEEKEMMRLLMQLDEASRRELLGYGRALAARLNRGKSE
jgi:DNA-binding phage protein